MAVSLGRYKQYGAKKAEANRLAKIYAEQQAQAQRRKGHAGLLGTVLGGLGGAALNFLIPGSGFLLQGALTGAGQFLGKKAGYEMTKGMAADPTQLKSKSKYGYGEEEAKTLREGLEMQLAEDPWSEQGGFGKEVFSGILGAATAEGMSWADFLPKKGGLATDIAGGGQKPTSLYNPSEQYFEQGGLVTPTIADYFGQRGVSLGGSNKQSLAEMLGRK